ncbi:hypothetical protein P885DRAFT_78963 [Corynascus similis CBS 632.67]
MSATEDSVAGFASRDQPRDSVRYPSLSQYRQNPEQEDDVSDAPQAEEQIETNNSQQSIADIDSQLAEEDRALREDRPPDLEHDPNLAWIDRKINLTQSTLYTTLREFRKLAATITSANKSTFPIPPEGVDLGHRHKLGYDRYEAEPSYNAGSGRETAPRRETDRGGDDPDPSDPSDDDWDQRRHHDDRHRRRNERQPPQNRYLFDDSRIRESTFDTEATQGTASSRVANIQVKREEIGQFNPSFTDPEKIGLVTDGKKVVYTDVYMFVERIQTFLEGDLMGAVEMQLVNLFQTLPGGPALIWWTNEVSGEMRRDWRQRGLQHILRQLERRFRPDAMTATRLFNESFLTLKDIAIDEQALSNYFLKKLHWARAMGILAEGNTNWQGVMTQIWTSTDLHVRKFLDPPQRYNSRGEYMLCVEESRSTLLAAAHNLYPHLQKKSFAVKSSSKAEDSSTFKSLRYSAGKESSSRHFSYKHDKSSKYDRHGHERGRDRREYDDRGHEHHRGSRRRDDKQRDERTRYHDKRGDHNRYRDRPEDKHRDRVHFADETSPDPGDEGDESDSASMSSGSYTSEAGVACMVLDADLTCHKCHKTFNGKTEIHAHVKQCRGKGPLKSLRNYEANLADVARRTCGFYSMTCDSRNALFRHLKSCKDAKTGKIRRLADSEIDGHDQTHEDLAGKAFLADKKVGSIAYADDKQLDSTSSSWTNIQVSFYQVKDAPLAGKKTTNTIPLGGYTHLRVAARTGLGETDAGAEVCLDPGASRSLIGKSFLQQLNHKVERRRGKVKGVGEAMLSLNQWATFDIYLPGLEDDKLTLIKFI